MNSSFEQTIERLTIDAGIRDLAARFSDAVNRRDPGAFGDLFADDGAWEIGEPFPSRDRTEHAMGDLPEEIRREVADATGPAEAARLIGRIAGEVGPPDVLVNTIGAFRPEDVLATTPEMLRLMLDVNRDPRCG
jgi:NAD(P)-dependent dehydrogenase (short-subunit alcohol dehydrogenase family)